MSIASGLTATKTALALAEALTRLLKRSDVDPGEVQSRIKELYDYFIEAQQSLAAANQEIGNLRQIIADSKKVADIEADLEMQADGQFYVRKSEKDKGLIPYYPVCWGTTSKLIPLTQDRYPGCYTCTIHNTRHPTAVFHDWQKTRISRAATPVRFRMG